MRAVIYCRVSDPRQAQNLSLSTQEETCRAYCQRQGYDVAEIFIDEGESAKTADRTAFRRMVTYCRERRGKVHAVVVYALTRFSRNSADHHAIATLLRGFGVVLRSATEPIDESPSGRLMEGILAAMAQFDNDQRSERVKAGMRAAAQRGRWVTRAPIGYRNGNRHAGEPSLVPDPERAPLVRRLFERVAAGEPASRELHADVTALGLRTRRGVPLRPKALHEVLRNPVYVGLLPSQGRVRGDFTPLVTQQVFDQVQARLDARGAAITAATRHVNHPDFPLRRFVRCATCGKGLTASWSQGRREKAAYYHCTAGCSRVRREALEDAFIGLLDALAPKPAYRRAFEEHVLDVWRSQFADATAARTRLQHQVSTLERRLSHIDSLFVDERLDEESYRKQRDRTREDLTVARLQLHETDETSADVDGMLAFALQALTQASAIWTSASTVADRMRIQSVFFPEGLTWESSPVRPRRSGSAAGRFIEPRNCCACFSLGSVLGQTEGMVDLTTPTWNQLAAFLAHMRRLPRAG